MKKTLITLICMLTFFCSFTARANEPPDSIEWSIKNGTLTITGNGAMQDYPNPEDAPWHNKKDEITKIVIEDGITRIGNLAFYGLTNAKEAVVPESVKSIGLCAFSYTEGTRTDISELDSDYRFELISDRSTVSKGTEFCISVELTADFKDISVLQTIVLFDMDKIAVDENEIFESTWYNSIDNSNLGYISKPMGGIVANNVRLAYISMNGSSIDADSPLYDKGTQTLTIAKIKCRALEDIEDVNTSCFYLKESALSLSDGTIPKCGETQLTTVTRLPMPQLSINTVNSSDGIYEQTSTSDVITVMANGEKVNYDATPYIDDSGVVMIPLRYSAEALGCLVNWHADTRTVFVSFGNNLAAVQIGQDVIFKNSENTQMSAEAIITNNRTMLPIEYFEKAFGFKTQYYKNTNTITISTK